METLYMKYLLVLLLFGNEKISYVFRSKTETLWFTGTQNQEHYHDISGTYMSPCQYHLLFSTHNFWNCYIISFIFNACCKWHNF